MSYATNTILVRNEPDDSVFDKLRVVGPSPISSGNVAAAWGGGQQSDLYICEPLGLVPNPLYDPDDNENHELPKIPGITSTEIIPLDALNEQYTIESEPDAAPTHVVTQQLRHTERKRTAEEVFRAAAKDNYKAHEAAAKAKDRDGPTYTEHKA